MHKVLAIVVVAVILASVGCAAWRSTIRSPGSRPQPVALTNSPPEFRQYDEALLNKVQKRWYDSLDSLPWVKSWTGKVVVSCHLHDDGRITDVLILENTASATLGTLCQKAILDPQPYPAWSQRMRKMAGQTRTLRISFYYD